MDDFKRNRSNKTHQDNNYKLYIQYTSHLIKKKQGNENDIH